MFNTIILQTLTVYNQLLLLSTSDSDNAPVVYTILETRAIAKTGNSGCC